MVENNFAWLHGTWRSVVLLIELTGLWVIHNLYVYIYIYIYIYMSNDVVIERS